MQERLGLNKKPFIMYKFRTMIPNSEKLLMQLISENEAIRIEYNKHKKLKNDPRIISGIGYFLRKTSLDELPQFFNILFGDMSIVGPRPYIPAEFSNYPDTISEQITSIKPGITGYWQIIPSRNDILFEERIKNDLKYLKKRTFILDLKIIFKTVWVMVLRRGA